MKEYIIETTAAIYTVTSKGDIYTESFSKTPICTTGRNFSGEFTVAKRAKKLLTTAINNRGYYTVRMAGKTKMVHRVVAEAFIPNPENKKFVNHIDGNKLNNNLSNLEWCTAQENVTHAWNTGLMDTDGRQNSVKALLENSLFKKLPDESVNYIRDNFKKRCPIFGAQAMSEKFGVSTTTISYIVNYKKAYA